MSIGLVALLDDVAAIAKVAAASIDDVAGQAAKAGAKAAGVVIDDAAVTPRYLVGFAADRELPIVAKIATGSLRNKIVILLPGALALSFFAPWAITPLLMLGGAFLCYEGAEKVYEAFFPHRAHEHEAALVDGTADPASFEDAKVKGAIKTDFILSAEIMAITLAAVPVGSFWMQAVVLAVVGIGITLIVYGGVALIVKADDLGVALARNGLNSFTGRILRSFGRGLVLSMPVFLSGLAIVGTAAMIWVGGGIIVHGLETYGFSWLAHSIHNVAAAVAHAVPFATGLFEWLIGAAGSGIVGLVIGALLIPLVGFIIAPVWKRTKALVKG
ncbi:MAG: DUF808 domain-containing protein, partial [Bosea sp. (in: a-proteobacteria)]